MHKIGDNFFAKDMMIEYKIFSTYHLDKNFSWKALVWFHTVKYGFKVNSTPRWIHGWHLVKKPVSNSKNFYKWGQLVQVRCGCLCQIFFSLLATIMFPTKIRPRNTRMFLCPGKCGCWRRVRLLFPSGFDFKANFSYIWDLQAQCLSEEKSKRNSKSMSYYIVFTFKEYGMGSFYRFIQKSSTLWCKKKEKIIYFQWK